MEGRSEQRPYDGDDAPTGCLIMHQVPTRPLYARAARHNIGSIRVLEKCGFTVCADPVPSAGHEDDVVEVVLCLH